MLGCMIVIYEKYIFDHIDDQIHTSISLMYLVFIDGFWLTAPETFGFPE